MFFSKFRYFDQNNKSFAIGESIEINQITFIPKRTITLKQNVFFLNYIYNFTNVQVF